MNAVIVDGRPFRLPAGVRVRQVRHVPRWGPELTFEWAWWRLRWSRPTKWM